MRQKAVLGIMGLIVANPSQALAAETPDLATRFFNTIPDVCFQTARGKPPTHENAARLLLESASEIPPTVKAHFNRVPTWFRLKAQPDEVFIGVGDSPGACHVVLANTKQTVEVRTKVAALLKVGGFQVVHENTVPGRVRQRGVNSGVASGLHFQAALGVICSGCASSIIGVARAAMPSICM